MIPGRGTLLALSLSAAIVACNTVCPSGTDERADPAGEPCLRDDECLVRCACYNAAADDEVAVRVGECEGDVCVGAEELCEDGCGNDELVAYCRPAD